MFKKRYAHCRSFAHWLLYYTRPQHALSKRTYSVFHYLQSGWWSCLYVPPWQASAPTATPPHGCVQPAHPVLACDLGSRSSAANPALPAHWLCAAGALARGTFCPLPCPSAADGGSWACLRAWSAGWTDTSQYSWEMGGWCVGNQPHRGSGSCSGARTFNLDCAPQFSSILVGGKREMIIYRNFIWSLRFLQNV